MTDVVVVIEPEMVTIETPVAQQPPGTGGGIPEVPNDGQSYARQYGLWVLTSAGASGVSTFNNRSGAITLTSGDIAAALTFTPTSPAALADGLAGKVDKVLNKGLSANDYTTFDKTRVDNLRALAFSASWNDLLDRPAIPAVPGDIGAATAAQGVKADAAVPTATYTAGLLLKVDKVAGYGLSKNDLTDTRAAKLDAMPDDHFKGIHTSAAALASARPTAIGGDYADVDAGVGVDSQRWLWDVSDSKWVAGGASGSLTAAQVLALYESNADRNAFTNSLKSKLDGIAAGATVNANTDSLPESGTPTNLWFTAARVRAAVATGISFADATAVLATDSILSALGKLQAQISPLAAAVAGALNRANHTGTQSTQSIPTAMSGMRHAGMGAAIMSGRRAVSPCLDMITTAPKGAWGMVKMRAGYAGYCCQVRNLAGATLDIPFAADGIVATDMIRAFRKTDAYITLSKLYDQTPNGYDAVQATTSLQPRLDLDYLRNGMPAVFSDATYLTLPSGVTITATNNCAVWAATGNFNQQVNSSPWCFGTSGQFEINYSPVSAFSVQPKLSSTALNFGSTATIGMRSVPPANGAVTGLNSAATPSGTGMALYRNNEVITRAALTGAGTQVINTVGGTFGTTATAKMNLYGLVLFDTALADADALVFHTAMNSAYSAVQYPKANVMIVGDSIPAGPTPLGHSYNHALMHHFGNNINVHVVAVGGSTVQTMAGTGQTANRTGPLFRTGLINVACLAAGTNDITGSRTPAQIYADMLTWTTAMKALGWTTVVQTLYPRPLGATGAGTVTQTMFDNRIAINNLIRANCGPGKELADYCIDVQTEPTWATTIPVSDFADGQHFDDPGIAKAGGIWAGTLYQAIPGLIQY